MRLLDGYLCLAHLRLAMWHEGRARRILDVVHARRCRRPTGPLIKGRKRPRQR